jgi:chloramphenicol-sensitive protein RarD
LSAPVDRRGAWCALTAFFIWGVSPLFFKALAWLPALEIVAHRVLWSVPLLALWIGWRQGFGTAAGVFSRPRLLALLCFTTVLTACNWLLYVWAIVSGHTVEASLGYFINPLFNVALGALVLGERLRPLQWCAVALAAIGVIARIVLLGHLPWIALGLAGTFGIYGLLRKRAPIDSVNGLFIETLLALPLASAFLAWSASRHQLHGGDQGWGLLLIPLAGLVTTVPFALFAEGVRRLPLSTLGLLQYLAPTLQFVCAVLIFHEAFSIGQLGSFALIWAGLALYSLDVWRTFPRTA